MPDKQQYWCVQCDECDGAIPVLEYDPDKDRLNPQAFEAACLLELRRKVGIRRRRPRRVQDGQSSGIHTSERIQ